MSSFVPTQKVAKYFQKLPLRMFLVVPFVLQTLGVVGVVGFLSYQSGQQSISMLSQRLMDEVGQRTTLYLKNTLRTPHLINQLNADAIQLGTIPGFETQDTVPLEQHFLTQLRRFPDISTIAIANERGGMIGSAQVDEGIQFFVYRTAQFARGVFTSSEINAQGNTTETITVAQDYDARTRPWYQTPVRAGQPSWSPIYEFVSTHLVLGISAGLPVYASDGRLRGVLATDITLSKLNQFLAELRISESGQIFIVERNGLLVATSTQESIFATRRRGASNQLSRLSATASQDALTRNISSAVLAELGDWKQITSPQDLTLTVEGDRFFTKVTPYRDLTGLDWLIVITVPKSDFMGIIQQNNNRTLVLCLLTLLASTTLGLLTSRWLTKPIRQLNRSAQQITQGQFNQEFAEGGVKEIYQLSRSLKQMTEQLQTSFTALQTSERTLSTLLASVPVGVSVFDVNGHSILLNQIGATLLGQGSKLHLSSDQIFQTLRAYLAGSNQPYPARRSPILRGLKGEPSYINDIEIEVNDKRMPLEVHTVPVCDNQGNVLYVMSAFQDITERKQAEQLQERYQRELEHQVAERTQELSQVRDLREAIFNESADGIFLVEEPPNSRILDCNWRAVELFEVNGKNDLIGIQVNTLQKRQFTLEELDEITEELNQHGFWSCEIEYVTRKGKTFWGNLAVKPIQVGGVAMQLVRLTDISSRKQLEFALQKSEARTKDILNSAIAAIVSMRVFKDGTWRVDQVSAGAEMISGYTPEELVQDDELWSNCIHPEDWQALMPQVLSNIFAEQPGTYEYRFNHKDGRLRWISQTNRSYWDEAARCWNVTAISVDITDRKQAEMALKHSEATLRAAQRVAHVGSWEFDIDTQTVRWSEELYRIYQCDPSQPPPSLEEILTQWIHPEDVEGYLAFVDRLNQGQSTEHDFRVTLLDGSIRCIAGRGEPIFDHAGKLVRLRGTALDITERRHTEDQLRRTQQWLQQYSRQSPGSIYTLVQEPDGRLWLEYTSSAVETIHEITREQALADVNSFLEQMHPDDRPGYAEAVARSLENLETFSYEWRITTPSGKLKWLQGNSQPERRSNGAIAWHGVIQDITNRKLGEVERKLAEEQLRKSEAALSQAQRVAHIGSWDYDVQTETMFWSEETFRILGLEPSQPAPTYQTILESIHLDDRSLWTDSIFQTIVQGMPYEFDCRIFWPDGSIRYVEARGEAMKDEKGNLMRLFGTILDITDRKRAEQALQQSEARTRAILDTIPDLIFLVSRDGIYLNYMKTRADFDLVPPEVNPIGSALSELLPPNHAQREMAAIEQALATGECQIYEQKIWVGYGFKYEEVRAIACGEDTVLMMVRDISARKQAEERLRESEERFRRAFDDAAVGMSLVSIEGQFLRVNQALCEMLGYTEAEMLSRSSQDITHPDDLSADLEKVQQLLTGKIRSYQFEKRNLHKQGHVVWISANTSVIKDCSGNPLYFISQLQDVSDRHELDRIKDEFISIVSHELRTPLTAIRGSLGILETGVLNDRPERAKHMLQVAVNNSERLVRLVNDILDLERLESGKVELAKQECKVADLLQQAVEEMQAIADKASVTLVTHPIEAKVWAAPDSILQTLTNLLSNAIKFSPADSVIEISAWVEFIEDLLPKMLSEQVPLTITTPFADVTPSRRVVFAVKDQGRGIPCDKLEEIFNRFQQVDASDSRQKGGTGLGLAICKSIVQQHGGLIWAESTLGQGSTFFFTLPMPPETW